MALKITGGLILLICLVDMGFCGISMEDMRKSTNMVRSVCGPKHKVTDDQIDGIPKGQFPDVKNLKCYTHCVLEMMGLMKKAKVNHAAAIKQIDIVLPEDMREANKAAINACKDSTAGVKDICEAGYIVVQCLFKNNPDKFVFT